MLEAAMSVLLLEGKISRIYSIIIIIIIIIIVVVVVVMKIISWELQCLYC